MVLGGVVVVVRGSGLVLRDRLRHNRRRRLRPLHGHGLPGLELRWRGRRHGGHVLAGCARPRLGRRRAGHLRLLPPGLLALLGRTAAAAGLGALLAKRLAHHLAQQAWGAFLLKEVVRDPDLQPMHEARREEHDDEHLHVLVPRHSLEHSLLSLLPVAHRHGDRHALHASDAEQPQNELQEKVPRHEPLLGVIVLSRREGGRVAGCLRK
mmetsp:Transcript_39166/g.112632  ORF Transcript_39166/g.112632 Transcript_39166/m.112632 type:complete len:209 (+) Transcript_39166:530-1156(+)